MRPFSKQEQAVVALLEFVGVDYATLQITQTGLDKGYTDATVPFRDFLRRNGIHDYTLQKAGEPYIKYANVFGLTADGPEILNVSFQRPATKDGRMYRLSMLGGLKNPLGIKMDDILIFFVKDNQLHLANLTQLTDRIAESNSIPPAPTATNGPTILTIAKNRILHVMESMPECEDSTGQGARLAEIGFIWKVCT